MPSAAYSRSVRTFASVNGRERKRASGNIGFRARRSTMKSRMSAKAPIARPPITRGCSASSGGHSSSPNTRPPRPRTASAAPLQSIRAVREGSRLSSSNRRRDRAETGPRADRPAAFAIVERRADDRQTAWHEEGGADTLQRAGGNQHRGRRREPAEYRRHRKEAHPEQEYSLAAELIAHRSAHENQRAQEQGVRLDDPLHIGDRGVQIGLERRQRDVDDRRIDERHARRKNRRSEDPTVRCR